MKITINPKDNTIEITPNDTMKNLQNKEFYHIQRSDSLHQWSVGQKIMIGNDYNEFFNIYYDIKILYQGKKDSYHILGLIDHILKVRIGEGKRIEDIDSTLYEEPYKLLECTRLALQEYTILMRELVFEQVRNESFQHYPSRLQCIWVIPNEESLSFWKTKLQGKIFKLRLTGQSFRGNNQFLTNDTFSINKYRSNASLYWAGIKGSESKQDEVLFKGEVEVIEELPW